ncbi:sugar phosphate isomerase/epimerase [Candidatus Sumerlaeota bacterium]|nr:sugar phosphate isomerase/epimerase [Candidatus Sumerlaeota bacterium]
MATALTRREFLAASAAVGAGLTARRTDGAAFKTTLRKSLIVRQITEQVLVSHKAAGFHGVETSTWNATPDEAQKARALSEKCGMSIHSVLAGWWNFNDPQKIGEDIKSLEVALEAARGYGADAVLMVPCRVRDIPMPEAWDFDSEFDEKTGHVTRVVKGDNAPYQKYIEAQNYATDVSREALKRLAPAAEKAKVFLAVENVWNNLWVDPALAANFVRSVGSPWVQFYFDIGNHVKYSPPEKWIRTLGKMIVKAHVKDFKLNPDGHGGKFVDIRDGSVNWPVVRKALDDVGYNGWMTIEGSGGLSLAEQSKRLDLIIAGK